MATQGARRDPEQPSTFSNGVGAGDQLEHLRLASLAKLQIAGKCPAAP
jgi:hypothetical protein